jgi:hypothetical protein
MFEIDNEIKNSVDAAWSASDTGVKLPFSVVLLWWKRGGDEREDGVRKFGGWVAGYEDVLENASTDNDGMPIIPEKLVQENFVSSSGNPYSVYSVRNIAFAPIGKRFKWTYRTLSDGSKDPSDKGRGHVQVFGLSSFLDDNKVYNLWKPVILSAKGLSAKSLQDAISEWERKTLAIRMSEGNGIPSNFFWSHLGTFGNEINKAQVGSGNKSNYITPVQIYLPQEINVDFLKKVFVGKGVATTMSVLAEEAKEWLEEWGEKSNQATDDMYMSEANDQDDFVLP